MKDLILKIVTTNSGWIARRVIMYGAVIMAAITTWLMAKGFSADTSTLIATGVVSILLGLIELVLSWIARKHKVPEAETLRVDINKLRGKGLLMVGGLCLLCVPSCTGPFLGLHKAAWQEVGKAAGMGALKGAGQAAMIEYGMRRAVTLDVTLDVTATK